MKRLIITMAAALLAATCLWAKDDEVIVTRQLTAAQRGSLPDKTIVVEMKRLAPAKHADADLLDAAFGAVGIEPTTRAETLSPTTLASLAEAIASLGSQVGDE